MPAMNAMTRRQALQAAAGLLGAPAMLAAAARQTSRSPQIPAWPTELRRLAPDIYAYTQATGPGVDNASLSNAGLIVGPESMLAIDTLGPPVHAKAFRAAAMQATGKPFGRVINTHHHRDHTNGNYLYVPLEIVAHEYCRAATIRARHPDSPVRRPAAVAGRHGRVEARSGDDGRSPGHSPIVTGNSKCR
jgi:glyoxylase-like metal-dependent hydrolase (beta-lactamase superfamily II)